MTLPALTRTPSIRVVGTLALLTTGLGFGGTPAQARPAHKQALADYFGPFLAPKLNDCRTCHLPDPPGGKKDVPETEKPHNPFGARLAAVKKELRQAGKKIDLASRLEAVADEDCDGDGASNLTELLTGHFPGDPADRPTPAEIAELPKLRAAFRKYRAAYPWRPNEPVRRPAVPRVRNADWVRNPIDAFVAAGHEERGLTPRPEAPRPVLLRRVTLDLTGLPPTPAELHAFVSDTSPDAYEKVVDRLLASPAYGERWGRHWMDVWRYSDWAGYGAQVRDSQPHVWHWRDWIVESLNEDKDYDRMVLEMLAGDELAPDDPRVLRATGYLVRNFKLLSRETWMQETVDHTAQAFLAATLGCARCHDHMFDPISQKEYYQVRAVFEPYNVRTDRLPGQPDIKKDGLAHAYDANPQAQTFLYVRGDERTPAKTPLAPGVPEALGGNFPEVKPVGLPLAATCPDKRDFVTRETVEAGAAAVAKARDNLPAARRTAVAALARTVAGDGVTVLPRLTAAQRSLLALALAEAELAAAEARAAALRATLRTERLEESGSKHSPEWQTAATETATLQRRQVLTEARRGLAAARWSQLNAPSRGRADAAKKLTEAEKALTQAESAVGQPPTTAYASRKLTTYPPTSTGRRLAFARWVADRANPRTARVAVNHVWLRHFGQAVVPSVFDFGRNGRPPTHPALLDWLAAEFMDRGWRTKALHRLIVTSSTYRMASTPDPADLARDRDNVFLWRVVPRRAEAEAVRDGVLFVAGQLDRALGGPDLDHHTGLTTPRRSLYFRHASEKQMEFLKLFDAATVTECYQRKQSIVPQQALALANSELTRRAARRVARDLAVQSGSDPAAFTAAAFERVLSRPPTAAELAECVGFIGQQAKRYVGPAAQAAGDANDLNRPSPDPALRARENLVQVLLNHHEFVTIR